MPAAVKVPCKGSSLSQSVSAVYVPIALLKSIDISGEKGETYDSTTLDGGQYKTKSRTGYVEPPTIKFDIFLDPVHASHTNFQDFVEGNADTNFKVIYADTGATSRIFNGVSGGLDVKIAMGDGLSASGEIVTSGAPT